MPLHYKNPMLVVIVGVAKMKNSVNKNFGKFNTKLFPKKFPTHKACCFALTACTIEQSRCKEVNKGDYNHEIGRSIKVNK